jgi:hypothetical protein
VEKAASPWWLVVSHQKAKLQGLIQRLSFEFGDCHSDSAIVIPSEARNLLLEAEHFDKSLATDR